MFNVSMFGSTFNSSPYYNGKINGYDAMVETHLESYDVVMEQFERAIEAGYNPNNVKADCFKKAGIKEEELTDSQKKRLITDVEKLYKQYHYRY